MATLDRKLSSASGSPYRSREAVLLVSLLLLLLLLAFTAFFSRMYKKQIHVLADEWFAKGQSNFQSGDYKTAVADFRNALAFSPDNPNFQFQLAKALSAAGKEEEAKAYFLTLLSEAPGSGEINLELARIAVRKGQMADAMRYFQGAIYGEWSSDPIGKRWQVRKEFCEYLLNQGTARQVEGELIALLDNTPPNDAQRLKTVGELLLRAQLWARALAAYHSVLALNKQDADALLGAGTSAFQLGDYSHTLEFLNRLPPEKKEESAVSGMLEISGLVLDSDPFRPGLSPAEKAGKAANAVAKAQSRSNDCAGKLGGWSSLPLNAVGLQKLNATGQSMQKEWSAQALQRNPDRIESAMAWVFHVENESANLCGSAQDENYALWLLGRSRANGGK